MALADGRCAVDEEPEAVRQPCPPGKAAAVHRPTGHAPQVARRAGVPLHRGIDALEAKRGGEPAAEGSVFADIAVQKERFVSEVAPGTWACATRSRPRRLPEPRAL
jgi:hypothetical protein